MIALDCRGHGKSDKPSEAGAYGAEMGRDVVRLLNHLQIRRAHLVGFSMGAFIVGHLLTTNPDRFLSATFVAHHPVRGWTTTDEQDAQASAQDLESDTPFRSLILGISPTETPPSEVEIRRLSQALVAANDPKALAAYHRGRHTLSVTDAQLAAVRVPTSAIIGNADPALAGVRDLKRIMPALSVTVIDGATHGGEHGVLRRSEFLTALRQFLNPPQSGRRAGLAFVRAAQSQERMLTIVAGIQRADYEGDRAALKRLHAELAPCVDDRGLAPHVLYWRGFARWRRALNGFNDAADRSEIEEDLTQCVRDFRDALARDPAFVDAKVGTASCLVNHSFLNLTINRTRAGELFAQSMAIFNEALAAAPDNPRLLWVQGANQWYATPEREGGQDVALATYERGLDLARRQKGRVADPLEPTWGEAELLMNLAFANLNRAKPDLAAAERYAQSALALVPYWHYVRDILLPQIRKAKEAVRRDLRQRASPVRPAIEVLPTVGAIRRFGSN